MSNYYENNPLIHKDRRLGASDSAWVRSFDCTDMRPLIVCRGPIRKEVMDVFEEMGIDGYGILLSEKDAIVYTHALAPELRQLTDPHRVHRVPDYTGADKAERTARIGQIIAIAKENGYNYVFAGYGFMAEDEEFVRSIEASGLKFIGPCSATVKGAGLKDEAKRTALEVDVSVTPGIDNVTTLTLLEKYPTHDDLRVLCEQQNLAVDAALFDAQATKLEDLVDHVLAASFRAGVDLFTIEELGAQVEARVAEMFSRYQGNRVRLKAIGGGGGKGQRILAAPVDDTAAAIAEAAAAAPGMVREILNEVKAAGVGDNKNVLIELNIEQTRHLEIQLIGNGDWSLSMGGRDCSLQMHEQKLLEISMTAEGLTAAIDKARAAGNDRQADALVTDRQILARTEEEAARFGKAVGLDSVSTFECIVDRDRHYFMEMNTRIQVEHRVTELCYALRFTNPDNPEESFVVDALVEAMTLLARHKERLPKPERVPRLNAAVESRLNATDRSLSPHAGGIITYWSDPSADEIRDDQGISLKNPDTGRFMKYRLAGAYDSNIALLVTHGEDREDSYRRLHENLRLTKLNGLDLATNLEFHYGLVSWFLGQNVYAKSTTRFVAPYLAMIGKLKREANGIDLAYAFKQIAAKHDRQITEDIGERERPQVLAASGQTMARKQTLLLRPMAKLLAEPHLLSGWISMHRRHFEEREGRVVWLENPLVVLAELYHFLNMDYREAAPAADVIWKHDHELLSRAHAFYETLHQKLDVPAYNDLRDLLADEAPQGGMDAGLWYRVRCAHAGYQCGMELLSLLPRLALNAGFFDLRVDEDLNLHIPEDLMNPEFQAQMKKVLVPPPATKADEIAAVCGGMYYPREAPNLPKFVEKGDHFETGQPLFIIEVMKMFNKVYAPFSGTIDEVLIEGDGVIVSKGQTLFKVTPDEKLVEEDPAEREARIRQLTNACLEGI